MRKLLLSVVLCSALVMGLLPAAAFAMELGNAPESVEKAPTSALEKQTVSEELLSEYGEQENAPKTANPAAQNDAAEIYVSSTGDDERNNGTKDHPFATLTKAVDAAADGATIYVMSNLTMDQCARFYDKSLKITSGKGGPFTITRSADFKQQSDPARRLYNPAMIEVQSSSASSVGLTLSNVILDDAGLHEGTVFAQAVSGGGNADNRIFVQDAIIASNATVPCTVTLGSGAVLRNFGGMSAVRATDQAKIVMESGSVIEDTKPGYTRTKGPGAGSVGPAGAIWLQGGTLVMEEGSKIQNVNGRGVYADGGKVEIGGAISNIAANKSAMWQANDGIAIHLRNNAEGTLTSTALIEKLSGGGSAVFVTGVDNRFLTEKGSTIRKLTQTIGVNCVSSKNTKLNGEITEVSGAIPLRLQTADVVLGEDGIIHKNELTSHGAAYVHNSSNLTIYGKINDNYSSSGKNAAALFIAPNGGDSHAILEEGGEICNNTNGGKKYGAAVELQQGNCSFTMNGGTISGNKGPCGAVQVHKDSAKFIMNGGEVTGNTSTTDKEAGIYVEAGTPTVELNAGKAQSITLAASVSALPSKGHVYIADRFDLESGLVTMTQDAKTVTPAADSLDIKLGNASDDSNAALKTASNSNGWADPFATFWVQRDGAAALTIGGLTLNDLPVYVLSLPVDETGKVLNASEAQVYEAQKTDTGDIDITLPDVSGNGYAVAVVQPSQNHGTLIINGPETIEKNKTGAPYPVTYTVTYDMSDSMRSIIEQPGVEAKYVLTIDHDARLTGNPGSFNGESIQVTYNLPNSEFRVGDVLLASAKLTITVGGYDYIVPSKVTKTQEVETTYSLTTQVNGGHGRISASKAGLAAGSHETIVFTPDSGYKIDTVTVNGVKAEVRSNMLEVIMDADKTVIVTYKGSTVKPSDQPDKSGNTASSNTGDSSNPVLWSALLFISGGAVIGTTVVSRKKKYNR